MKVFAFIEHTWLLSESKGHAHRICFVRLEEDVRNLICAGRLLGIADALQQ